VLTVGINDNRLSKWIVILVSPLSTALAPSSSSKHGAVACLADN